MPRVVPGRLIGGSTTVPGDKSIAHRWLMLAATASGRSRLSNLPDALDVVSTARCLSRVAPNARRSLEGWCSNAAGGAESHGFTWDVRSPMAHPAHVEVEGEGRTGLVGGAHVLDCGNSGTTMRLLTGLLAPIPGVFVLTGDESLRRRPMERVAEPLRRMGATVETTGGAPPVRVVGGPIRGIRFDSPVASAQVKSAVVLAGTAADGETVVTEPAPTRDHTERALVALGAPIDVTDGTIVVRRFDHPGFEAAIPGDVSSAAFLLAAAALTGGELTVDDVGLNPTRLAFVAVLRRMGVAVEADVGGERLGEPVGRIRARRDGELVGTTVEAHELPLLIDEVAVLAAVAAHARGDSWFVGAAELRVKESDRLAGIVEMIRGLGGEAALEGDDLVLAGGGLAGGRASSRGDHRMAMAATVAALAAERPSEIDALDAAAVSFPGFAATVRSLGAMVEP